jgi:hypothetical protein
MAVTFLGLFCLLVFCPQAVNMNNGSKNNALKKRVDVLIFLFLYYKCKAVFDDNMSCALQSDSDLSKF